MRFFFFNFHPVLLGDCHSGRPSWCRPPDAGRWLVGKTARGVGSYIAGFAAACVQRKRPIPTIPPRPLPINKEMFQHGKVLHTICDPRPRARFEHRGFNAGSCSQSKRFEQINGTSSRNNKKKTTSQTPSKVSASQSSKKAFS